MGELLRWFVDALGAFGFLYRSRSDLGNFCILATVRVLVNSSAFLDQLTHMAVVAILTLARPN